MTSARAGKAPPRGKWPLFHSLAKGKYFEAEVEHHAALRAKASRMGKTLRREFTVRKVEVTAGGTTVEVIRVYRNK